MLPGALHVTGSHFAATWPLTFTFQWRGMERGPTAPFLLQGPRPQSVGKPRNREATAQGHLSGHAEPAHRPLGWWVPASAHRACAHPVLPPALLFPVRGHHFDGRPWGHRSRTCRRWAFGVGGPGVFLQSLSVWLQWHCECEGGLRTRACISSGWRHARHTPESRWEFCGLGRPHCLTELLFEPPPKPGFPY